MLMSVAGEICREWQSWSQRWHVRSILGSVLLQTFFYVALAVSLCINMQAVHIDNIIQGGLCGQCCGSCPIICAIVSISFMYRICIRWQHLSSAFHTGSEYTHISIIHPGRLINPTQFPKSKLFVIICIRKYGCWEPDRYWAAMCLILSLVHGLW